MASKRSHRGRGEPAYDVAEPGHVPSDMGGVQAEFERLGERVRVEVHLDRGALEDLEVMVRHRHRGATRDEVIGHAVMWLRAKEAAWLLRIKAAEERAARRAAEEERRLAFDRAEWERVKADESVRAAVEWARGDGSVSGQSDTLDGDG